MNKLGVRKSLLPTLGILKGVGALGLVIGFRVPLIGIASAVGLTLFFTGAIITHLQARDYSLGNGVPVVFLAIVVAALMLRVHVLHAAVLR